MANGFILPLKGGQRGAPPLSPSKERGTAAVRLINNLLPLDKGKGEGDTEDEVDK